MADIRTETLGDCHDGSDPGSVCRLPQNSCDKSADKDFCEPPNLGNFIWRLPEAGTDQSCNQLSASRITFLICGLSVAVLTSTAVRVVFWAMKYSKIAEVIPLVSVLVAPISVVAGVAAGVYFMSTVKDFRWRRWRNDNDNQSH